MSIIKEVQDKLSNFKNLYDIIRIVDPLNKEVIYSDDQKEQEIKYKCYCIFNKNVFCKNCISMRAYLEDDTFVKLEYNEEQVFLVIATPVIIKGNRYVAEIIKDISKNGFIKNESIDSLEMTESLISGMNDKIIKDELTGIYNRRYIDERLPVDVNNSVYKAQPISVIMADIDFFKSVNDNYGHIIGDKVLSDFAKLIKSSIRNSTDWVGRYGGEEFLIVLNNTNAKEAYEISEKLRKLIENTEFCYDGAKLKITSSFGVYSPSNKNLDSKTLISNVDKNLYEAKRSGRNRTIINEQ